uniref:HaeIII family restriction endonuclease n=1 Tax=Acetatifactor sp. TaxID=1872090 RepID=UPI004024F52E
MSFKVISMFSGAGGLDMGFHNKGFEILWANDFSKDACDTYDRWANYNSDGTRKKEENCTIIECGDITKIDLTAVLPNVDVDVVLGGFPCQGFSLAGPRQVDDSRNVLYKHFVKMVGIKNPKVIVAENVIGIKTLGDGAVFRKIIEDFSELGYTMSAPTINAKNFGVPQDRMRVIFIGIRNDICHGGAYIFPEGDPKIVTLKEALKNVGQVSMDDVCQAAFSSRYMSRNRKRDYDNVSFTIPAMAKQVPLSPDSDGMVFKDVDQFEFVGNNRRLSYREAAAIQTFPSDMIFCGDLDSKYKQIGNAVPVKLAEAIATEVYKILTVENLTPLLNMENPEAEVRADRRITNTVINGKAFEYATLIEIYNGLRNNGWKIEVIQDKNFQNIQKAHELIEKIEDDDEDNDEFNVKFIPEPLNDYRRAARVAAKYLLKVEPILQENRKLYATLQAMPDSAGIKGDVRDVDLSIFTVDGRDKIREIGISCKNNHEAVKHPRITENPDFASEWTNGRYHCGESFLKGMFEIFERIDQYAEKYEKWSLVEDKMDAIYYPIIKLFVAEIRRLGMADENAEEERFNAAKEFTQMFFEYMFGTQDFYKFIKDDNSNATKVYPYNMHGTLMAPYGECKNDQAVQSITMPEEIVEVRIKPKSKTTIEIYFDQWIISMRLHNADTKITRTSLKFDVQIKAQPRKVMGTNLGWND